MSSTKLIVIGGPTASGKSQLAVDLALHYGTEIISGDSRQFYEELKIGVARPTEDELSRVKHHFVADRSIHQELSAGQYAQQVSELLEQLFKRYNEVVVVGGSGLYLQAITQGFHKDLTNAEVRQRVNDLHLSGGLTLLNELLKEHDLEEYQRIDQRNPQRVMRAVERVLATGKTHSELRTDNLQGLSSNIIEIGIDHPRELLYQRINDRVDQMIEDGLLDEVRSLLPNRGLNVLKTVGYKELFEYLDGSVTLEKAIDSIKQNTRRYAKRQLTWFRNKTNTQWISTSETNALIDTALYLISQQENATQL